jgi:hypothetical protein
VTPSGIEPATFRLVAQCFNQLCHQQRAPNIEAQVMNETLLQKKVLIFAYDQKYLESFEMVLEKDGEDQLDRSCEK